MPCAICHREVRSDTLTAYEGELICSRCLKEKRDLKEAGARKYRAISDKAYRKTEIQRLLILLVVFLALGAIIFLRWMGYIGLR